MAVAGEYRLGGLSRQAFDLLAEDEKIGVMCHYLQGVDDRRSGLHDSASKIAILSEIYSDVASSELIDMAASFYPPPGTMNEDFYYQVSESKVKERTEEEVIRALRDLRNYLSSIEEREVGIGHNQPPEEEIQIDAGDLRDVKDSAETILHEVEAGEKREEVIRTKLQIIVSVTKGITNWIGKRAEKGIDSFLVAGGASLAASMVIDGGKLLQLLQNAIGAVNRFLSIFFS